MKDNWYIKFDNFHPRIQEVKDYIIKKSSSNGWLFNNNSYYGETNGKIGGSLNPVYFSFCEFITIDELLEMIFPEKWAIKSTNPLVKDWINKNSTTGANYSTSLYKYFFHYPMLGAGHLESSVKPGYTEITEEQFINHFCKKEYKEMKKLTKRQLIDLYNKFTCTDWKNEISFYLDKLAYQHDEVQIEIKESSLSNLKLRGTEDQKRAVSDLGIVIEGDKNAFVKKFNYDDTENLFENFSNTLTGNKFAIQLALDATKKQELEGKSIFISSSYEVVIEKGAYGGTVIVINKI